MNGFQPRRRWATATLRVLIAAVFLGVLSGSLTAQATSLSFAGLVVRYADGELAYAYVGFPEQAINGIDLLERSGLDIVTISFGGLGQGVCSIDAHGCPATECRRRVCQGPGEESPFWQYFRQSNPGEWKPLVLGASQTKVHDGDLDGWSWTPKDPGLPALSIAEIAELAGYDGVAFTGIPAGQPGAVFRRVGFSPDERERPDLMTYLGGAAVLATALGGVGYALLWRRRAAGESP